MKKVWVVVELVWSLLGEEMWVNGAGSDRFFVDLFMSL